ncbi:MAG: hypothetical protein U5R06_17080 [candidate division KSB1 bacterium]|nr:hypothetical protein [candidate division KSB1 bacterium]
MKNKKLHIQVDIEVLKKTAPAYRSRPPFIINVAKKRLKTVATLLGSLVQHRKMDKEIKQRLQELEIFNNAAVDRELLINEHRKEINNLLQQLGRPPKYDIVE